MTSNLLLNENDPCKRVDKTLKSSVISVIIKLIHCRIISSLVYLKFLYKFIYLPFLVIIIQ